MDLKVCPHPGFTWTLQFRRVGEERLETITLVSVKTSSDDFLQEQCGDNQSSTSNITDH